jgi:hypothetical protein
VANKCIVTVNKHEKADFLALSQKKARLQEEHALSHLINRISPIFNKKSHLH